VLSQDQFRAQMEDRWRKLGVTYHHTPTQRLMDPNPDAEARLRTWGRSDPVDRVSIPLEERLHTDQSNLNLPPRSYTPTEPIHVVDHAGRRWLQDGHHRLAQARMAGRSIDALVWRVPDE
jgi:hypothetical protein